MPWEQELLQHMDLQRPQAAAEGDVLGRGDALVAEHQHVVVQVRAVQAGEVGVVERTRQVQAQHLGAQGLIEGVDLEILRGSVRQVRERGGVCRGRSAGRSGEDCHGRGL